MKILFLTLLLLLLPSPAFAATPLPGFGGYVVAAVPCTCPPFGWNIYYAPFYPSGLGALTFTFGASIPYAYQQFIVVPALTSWELGNFIPGAGVCLVGAPPACVLLPSQGLIFEVGASYPGFTPAG